MNEHREVETIESAIADYAARIGGAGTSERAPYDGASLAAIYGPRVQRLVALRAAGYRFAAWGWNDETGQNDWLGVIDETEENK